MFERVLLDLHHLCIFLVLQHLGILLDLHHLQFQLRRREVPHRGPRSQTLWARRGHGGGGPVDGDLLLLVLLLDLLLHGVQHRLRHDDAGSDLHAVGLLLLDSDDQPGGSRCRRRRLLGAFFGGREHLVQHWRLALFAELLDHQLHPLVGGLRAVHHQRSFASHCLRGELEGVRQGSQLDGLQVLLDLLRDGALGNLDQDLLRGAFVLSSFLLAFL
mmetsp:Transcript_40595/g.116114  ORF Transcript_40595/g.116114 Transcript_40595/m.116114 type:complete len:216 (-) Transcript_40595:1034-1681(-)